MSLYPLVYGRVVGRILTVNSRLDRERIYSLLSTTNSCRHVPPLIATADVNRMAMELRSSLVSDLSLVMTLYPISSTTFPHFGLLPTATTSCDRFSSHHVVCISGPDGKTVPDVYM